MHKGLFTIIMKLTAFLSKKGGIDFSNILEILIMHNGYNFYFYLFDLPIFEMDFLEYTGLIIKTKTKTSGI